MIFFAEGKKAPSNSKIWKKLQKLDSFVKEKIKDAMESLEDHQESLEDKQSSFEDDILSLENKYDEHDEKFDAVELSIQDLEDKLALAIVENAGEDLITDQDLQGTPQEILGKLAQKVFFSPVEPKGTPFKPVNGPNGNDSRIGIVGAGAGGVHMAYLLKQKGFTNVTILEKSNRVGGLVGHVDLRGTRMTYHIWNDRFYQKTLVPLLDKFGFGPDIVNTTRDHTLFWPTNDANIPGMWSGQFVIASVMQEYQISDPSLAYQLILKQFAEYTNIYIKIFGKPETTFMRRPDPLYMTLLSGTIMDFVERFSLQALKSFFRNFFHINGYGTIDTVPVTYLFIIVTPGYLMELGLLRIPYNYMNNRSLQELFPMMIEDQDINTIFNFEVSFIEKLGSGKYKLHSKNGTSEEYDFLIWAGTPFDLPQLLYPCDMKNYLFDLLKTQHSHYVTASFLSMKNSIRGAPVQVYGKQFLSDTYENTPMVDYDVHAAGTGVSIEDYISNNFTYKDGSSADVKTFWSLQYCFCEPSEEETTQTLTEHYEKFNGTDISVDAVLKWDQYFPRWNVEAAAQGKHWDLYDFQGTDNVWIIGGGAVFENLNSIMEYNQLLISNMI